MSDQSKKPILYVPSVDQLKCQRCYLERWKRVKGLTHLSRRKLVLEIEQFFARSFDLEFRLIDTNEIFHPGWCWSDIDARWMSQYLETDSTGEYPKRLRPRRMEYQIQLEIFLQCSTAQYAEITNSLRQTHGHPGQRT